MTNDSSRTPIVKSYRGLVLSIIITAIGTLIILFLTFFIINEVFGWADNTRHFLSRLAVIVYACAWVFAMIGLWWRWNASRYEMDSRSIIVHTNKTLLESSRVEYFYSTLSGAEIHQDFLGKLSGYGDIVLVDTNGNKLITLSSINNPYEEFERISGHIKSR